MKKIQIPKTEKKVKMLAVPVTQTEHQNIKKYCNEQNVSLATFIRFALDNTYNLNTL
ncbi:hypothetical protein SAMN05444274_10686 [Mariniphaga anaerophila]|uniref:Uncharacterized protein n=1 Tax=Mariniphaga anaerophila TaxID=1484053 RepID=A0A1M5CET4_9BACT|nr:hypothetical protein [Mariniphaga anaerophila]SHF53117.1 hypothetical protein SAMN05444274_10686 [Mariniphaga anaerophila]